MTRVLVTGATGRVGSGVVRALADAPVTVRIASRDPDTAREEFAGVPGEDRREYVAFDLSRPETWGFALEGVDRLFLLLPPAGGVDPVREFVDAAVRVGVRHVVYLSILGAEKVPVLPHRRIERHVERVAPAYTFLRAAYFMQNLTDIHRPEVVERDELFVPAGDGALGFVDARDVSRVAAAALTEDGHETRAYDLTGPESLDFHDVAAVFSDVLDRRVSYADPSRRAFARRMLARDVPLGMVLFMLAEYQVTRFGLSGRTTDDVARVLDREPTTLREFVADHREQFAPADDA